MIHILPYFTTVCLLTFLKMMFTFQRPETTEKSMSLHLNVYFFNNNCFTLFDLILLHNKVIMQN